MSWIKPPVLDVGGNHGELGRHLGIAGQQYVVWNSLDSPPWTRFRTVVLLAVLEHLPITQLAVEFFDPERIVVTTPAPGAHPVLSLLRALGLLDAQNLAEHKRYWTEAGLREGLFGRRCVHYERFDLFNQLAVYE